MKYLHVARWVAETPWAILPSKLAEIRSALAFLMAGGQLSEAELAEISGAARAPNYRTSGAVAVLPLYGTIANRAGSLADSSGGTSVETFTRRFREAMADRTVGSIVIDVDSPGGTVEGVEELAGEIYAARATKQIIASASPLAASAAYWIASAAHEVAVTPSGQVGSIGVFAAHDDLSKLNETLGVKTTLVSAGRYKTEGNPYEPLSEEARAEIQGKVDEYYDMFIRAVARGRNISLKAVREGFGEGRLVMAKRAVEMGMADRVETLDQTISRLMSGSTAGRAAGAEGAGSVILARQRFELETS